MVSTELTLGIDVGGTKVAIGAVDIAGNVVAFEHINTRKDGPNAVVCDIVAAVTRLKLEGRKISSAGVGVAGQIAPETGVVHFAPNLGWKEFPLATLLSESLRMPVRVINDVRAITWGEWLHGAGQGCRDLLCLFVGTGIGGGIVSDGKILTGSDNAAGEVGHMTVDMHGSLCSCGNRGCFETVAAGWAIARRAKEVAVYDPAGSKGMLALVNGNIEELTAHHVFLAAQQHVPAALKVIDEVKEGLIAGVASLLNTINPKRVILGGGVIENNPMLVDVVRQGVAKRALPVVANNVEIVHAALKENAGVIGTAAYARSC